MKKIFSLKRILFVLLFALTLTTGAALQGTSATENASELPSGKNYIEIANMVSESGMFLYFEDIITVKANTTYVLSTTLLSNDEIAISIGTPENHTLYMNLSENDGLSLTNGGVSFTTGSSTDLYIYIVFYDGSAPTYIAGLQLEEGSVSTSYETYNAPAGDTIAPSISGAGTWYSNVDSPDYLAGILATLSATDDVDGDVTASIVVTSDLYTGNETTIGSYDITFESNDAAGNIATLVITVLVVDVTNPVINLIGDSTVYVEYCSTYSEPGTSVSDNVDSLTAVITGTVDNLTLGTYTLYYNVTDLNGNTATEVTRTVIVRDTTSPVITLTGDSTTYVEFGSNYTELGATVSDKIGRAHV